MMRLIAKAILIFSILFFFACKTEAPNYSNEQKISVSKKSFCEVDKDFPSVGDPSTIVLPLEADLLYEGNAPTYKALSGVNVNMGNQGHFKEMKQLNHIFSHARTFHFMDKDYWDDGYGQANGSKPESLRKYDPKEIKRLKLLVDKNGFPLRRNNFEPGDQVISFDPVTETLVTEQLKQGFYNVYENYLNQNWIYQKSVSDQFDGNLQMTLTVVNAHFPKGVQQNYGFPNQWYRDNDWGDVRLSAKAYAMLFARAYAPKDGSYQVCKVLEIGNEPWGLKSDTYQKLIDGFTEGFESYYGSNYLIDLIPAAFQGNHFENQKTADHIRANWKDYFGTRLNTVNRCKLSGINIHNYPNDLKDRPFNGWFKERLIAAPEQASSAFLFAKNAWNWVHHNMPENHRNIYATEFGWDTSNDCKDKVNATAVGEAAQGVYVCRALLMLSRMGVKSANVFELLDDYGQNPCQFAYHSSGFYKIEAGKAVEKESVSILSDFMTQVGNLKFSKVLMESPEFYLFELTNDRKTFLVGWLPININNQSLDKIYAMKKTVNYNGKSIELSPVPKLIE